MIDHPADTPPPLTPEQRDAERQSLQKYWRANLTIMGVLLGIWAVAGLGCGVLFADMLNQFHLPGTGYPLGFWFAQQGSIIVFVFIILAYCILLNRLDKKHHNELEAIRGNGGSAGEGSR